MEKNKRDLTKESQKITSEMLSKHASTLTHVLYRLRKDYPDLTTDDFWSAIREHWNTSVFQKALRNAKRDLRPFRSLIKLATKELPRANKEGFFICDGKKWGTLNAISRALGLCVPTIKKHTGSLSKKGRITGGQIYLFYPVDPILKACAYLLATVPKADKDGFFYSQGRRYGTMEAFIRELKLANTSIKARVSKLRGRKGKVHTGHLLTFYHDQRVYDACSDLLATVPRLRKGFVIVHGKELGSLRAIAKRLGIGERTITVRCKKHNIKSSVGLNHLNRKANLYPLQKIREICADLLKEIPKVQSNGFVKCQGETWGTCHAIQKRFKLSHPTVAKRIASCRYIEGRDYHGHNRRLYSLVDMKRETSALRNLPSANSNGLIKFRGELWGTCWALAQKIRVSAATIRKYKNGKRIRKIKALDRAGHPAIFFSYADIKNACTNTLKGRLIDANPITPSQLKQHAPTLSRVLYELRRKYPTLTSDQLWKKITKRWSAKQLADAVAAYRNTKRVTRFSSLLK